MWITPRPVGVKWKESKGQQSVERHRPNIGGRTGQESPKVFAADPKYGECTQGRFEEAGTPHAPNECGERECQFKDDERGGETDPVRTRKSCREVIKRTEPPWFTHCGHSNVGGELETEGHDWHHLQERGSEP